MSAFVCNPYTESLAVRLTQGVVLGTLRVEMTNHRSLVPKVQVAALACLVGAGLSLACSSSSSPAAAAAGAPAEAGANAAAGMASSIGGESAGGSGGSSMPSGITFHKDVEPLLQRSCQSCHVQGGIGPFSLVTFAEARVMAGGMAEETALRIMPPWHAQNTAECTVPLPWKNDTRLSDAEIATFQAWKDDGMPEGDPKDAPPPRAQVTGLPGVQQELAPGAAYELAPGGDEFRCFILDPKLAKDSFVNGVFVVPGNDAVVHHVLVFTDPGRKSLDNVAAGETSYDCFGGARVADSSLLTAWTPGGVPLEYPSNIAAPLSAGTLLVMQIHYHPHSATDKTTDSTKLQLRFSDTAPAFTAVTALIGNFKTLLANGDGLLPGPDDPAKGPAFQIPPNVSNHTETMQWTFKAASTLVTPRLYGIGGHMHYVGVDEKITLERADGTNACLMQIPHWDFDWQRRYDYDAPIDGLLQIKTGDKLGIRCTYDNTMKNPKVAESLIEQGLKAPSEVDLGETTLDEMCLASMTVIYPSGK